MGSAVSFENVLADFDKNNDEDRVFLNSYSKKELIALFDQFLFPSFPQYPREGFIFELDCSDPFVHVASVSHQLLSNLKPEAQFVLKIFVRRVKMDPQGLKVFQLATPRCKSFDSWLDSVGVCDVKDLKAALTDLPNELDATVVEFLFMQNPLARFAAHRRQLPGQNFPGLGLGKEMLALLSFAGKKTNRDMLVENPQYLHNALIYFKAGMRFLSPHCEAFFEILMEDLAHEIEKDFANVAHACNEGRIECLGEKFVWPVCWEQVLPLSKRAIAHVEHGRPLIEQLKKMTKRPIFLMK